MMDNPDSEGKAQRIWNGYATKWVVGGLITAITLAGSAAGLYILGRVDVVEEDTKLLRSKIPVLEERLSTTQKDLDALELKIERVYEAINKNTQELIRLRGVVQHDKTTR